MTTATLQSSGRRKRSLKRKFLSRYIAAVLAAATVLMGVWEYLGYREEVHKLEGRLNDVVEIQSAILERPVWNLETERIELILQAILRDEDFVSAVVTDDTGSVVVHKSGPDARSFLTSSQSIVRTDAGKATIIGELTIVASDDRIFEAVLQRAEIDLALFLLLLVAVVVAALHGFEKIIARPLSHLLEAIHLTNTTGRRQVAAWKSDDEMGELVRAFNSFQEESARYEQELRDTHAQLEARVQDRTAELVKARDAANDANHAKSEFLAVMSHELRTPLNGILGLTDALRIAATDKEQAEQLGLISESGQTLLHLLNDILDLSKVEAGSVVLETQAFRLEEHVRRAARMWRSFAQSRGLEFRLILPDTPLPPIVADANRLRQILNNFLNNSFKFTETGHVSLSVDCAQAEGGSYLVRFEIEDTGVGIAPELHEAVFARFTQADASTTRQFGGSGLGLAICREFAELMGGAVGVKSEVDKGSCFWFTIKAEAADLSSLPVAEADPEIEPKAAEAAASNAEPGAAGQQLRILVAEDNFINQKVIQSILRPPTYLLTIVGNGQEAVEAVQDREFDLVLMDIRMPVLDGPGATARIRALDAPEKAALPIVALTANAMSGDRKRYLDLGMDDYVTKPIDRAEIIKVVHRLTGASASEAEAQVRAATPKPAAQTPPPIEQAHHPAQKSSWSPHLGQ